MTISSENWVRRKLLEDGNDVLIISSGLMTMRALEAAEKAAGR